MNDPSGPWVCGTTPPVVITTQVPTSGWEARSLASWARALCLWTASAPRPAPRLARAVRRDVRVSLLCVIIMLLCRIDDEDGCEWSEPDYAAGVAAASA